jgi:hypothetical protein
MIFYTLFPRLICIFRTDICKSSTIAIIFILLMLIFINLENLDKYILYYIIKNNC